MKVSTTHFVFDDNFEYKDLTEVFPEILKTLLIAIDQVPEEEEILQMFIELNLIDLERNLKPEGYNRKGKIRMIFPYDRKEFYLRTYGKSTELVKPADDIGKLLTAAGIKFEKTFNDNIEF